MSNTKTGSFSKSPEETTTPTYSHSLFSDSSTVSSGKSFTNTFISSKTDSAIISQSSTDNLSLSASSEPSNTKTLPQTQSHESTLSASHSITTSDPCVKELLKKSVYTLEEGSNLLFSKITYFPDKSSVLVWSEAEMSGVTGAINVFVKTLNSDYSPTSIQKSVVSDPYITWTDIGTIGSSNFVVSWALSNTTSNKYIINTKVLNTAEINIPDFPLPQTTVVGEASKYQSGIFKLSSYSTGYTIGFMTNQGALQLHQFDQSNNHLQTVNKYLCNYATSFDLLAYDQTIKLALGYFDNNGIDLLTYNSGTEGASVHIEASNVNKVLLESDQEGNTIVAWQEKSDCSTNAYQVKAFAQIFHNDNTTSKTQISISDTGLSIMTSVRLIESGYYVASFLSTNKIQINLFYRDALIHSYQENHNQINYLDITPVISKDTNVLALDCNTASIMALYGDTSNAVGTLFEVIYEKQPVYPQSNVRNAEAMELNSDSSKNILDSKVNKQHITDGAQHQLYESSLILGNVESEYNINNHGNV